jgi:hypothetical protein
MTQTGETFHWERNPRESANGTIHGTMLVADWGSGQGNGHVTQTDAANRATRIQWNSGEVFVRAASPAISGRAVVGSWTWLFAPPGQPPVSHGTPPQVTTFGADGRFSSTDGNGGIWQIAGHTIVMRWPNSVDTLTLSADGLTMRGTNNANWNVMGTRGRRPRQGAARDHRARRHRKMGTPSATIPTPSSAWTGRSRKVFTTSPAIATRNSAGTQGYPATR